MVTTEKLRDRSHMPRGEGVAQGFRARRTSGSQVGVTSDDEGAPPCRDDVHPNLLAEFLCSLPQFLQVLARL